MLSKEEIEKAKEYFEYQIELAHKEIEKHKNDEFKGYGTLEDIAKLKYCNFKIISNYIEQLETREQKLIEKSEEDIKKNNEFEFMPLQIEKAYNNYYKLGKIDEAQELLKILKGENDE